MIRTALLVFLLIALALVSGCGNNTERSPGPGVVGQLTGDADDEVSAETQLLVSQAIALDENDAPLDF